MALFFVWNRLFVVSGLFPFLGFHFLPFWFFVVYFEEEVGVWAIGIRYDGLMWVVGGFVALVIK